ncbi:ABC transporter permease [Chlorobium sp. BLA1]|uniref:ABC transporter permease n=1 Tax=Candidatus Chlorobium masyuteum TaxID=2716876 RepID=UPI0014202FB2|nr:FtsX-like permease family protein [Candidatus Chlorobium masyuteum]NHQ61127.1 ABC transporter permease [Candidatus Chlorobium masyuteum]
MKPQLYIARRFAFKQRSASRPTFIIMIAVIGIAVGTAALILTLSIVKGFAGSVEQKLISFSAHMQIRYPDDRLFQERRQDLLRITQHPDVTSAAPFLEKSFVLRSRRGSTGDTYGSKPVVVKGVTPEQRTIFLTRFLKEGSPVMTAESEAIELYAGEPLAEHLGLSVGQKVMLVGLGRDSTGARLIAGNKSVVDLLSSLDLEIGVIRGIYDTGLQEGFDDFVLITDLKQMQSRFNPLMISGYDANVEHFKKLPDTVKEIVATLGLPFYGYTVFQRYSNLFEWLKLQKNIMPMLIVTITIVAVFNIISTLLVLIIEKTREIGMLSALGLEPAKISRLFMSQAFLIALSGIAAGNILALSLSLFELRFHLITLPEKSYFIKYVPLLIDPFDYAAVSIAVMILTLLFAFIPARIAASLKPGTALST